MDGAINHPTAKKTNGGGEGGGEGGGLVRKQREQETAVGFKVRATFYL